MMAAARAMLTATRRIRAGPAGAGARHTGNNGDTRRWFLLAVHGVLLTIVWMAAPAANAAETCPPEGKNVPCLMEGKTTLHQRVLTRPSTLLRQRPAQAAASPAAELPALTHLFVYGRRQIDGHEWLHVGSASRGGADGWIRGDEAIAWRQTLTMTFTNPANRDPALFFGNRQGLVALIESELLLPHVEAVHDRLKRGELPVELPVISIEPDTYVDFRRNFYLLPILDHDEALFDTGDRTRLLKVAAVTLKEGQGAAAQPQPQPAPAARDSLSDFRTAIVFVIDTTTSMGPYIERTRQAVAEIYRSIAAQPWRDRVTFGMVGFRDNVAVSPGLEYLTRVYAQLEDGLDPQRFLAKVQAVEPAQTSSRGFQEDAYAGVMTAIEEMDWQNYDGRIIVLITDAPARQGADELSSTKLNAEQVASRAREEGIALYVLHLLTPAGRHTHETGRTQHQALARHPQAGSLYFDIEAGAVSGFGAHVDELVEALVGQIEQAQQGRLASPEDDGGETGAEAQATLRMKTAMVGRAMQLAYLGRSAEAPSLLEAWIADRDLVNPSTPTLEVRVLITKDQLSLLQEVLKGIVHAAEEKVLDPLGFFDEVRSVTATLSRRPEAMATEEVRRLGDVGMIGEYLDDLPYHSKVLKVTESVWLSASFGWQQAFQDELESKIRLYESLHDDTDLWIALDGGRIKGDAVYPIRLDDLP
jgi:serine/threonine-protein kinase PpkA